MKPRVLQPYKILAVALTAGLGCTTPVHPEPSASTSAPIAVTPEADRPPAAVAEHALVDSKDPKLIALRGELGASKDRAAAQERAAHFRPLCDADGYPLVGNVLTKAPAGVQPSDFCADVRAKSAGK